MANATFDEVIGTASEPGTTTFQVVELLLKDAGRLDEINREPARQADLLPRFLLIALTSYLVFSFVMVLIINLAPAAAYADNPVLPLPAARWSDGTALALPLGYTISIILAACVCLPSFYFYSLLAGVCMTWLQIVSLVGKGTAANAIMLLGILPIYVAAVMGLIVFAALALFAMGNWRGLDTPVRVGAVGPARHLPGHCRSGRRDAGIMALPARLFSAAADPVLDRRLYRRAAGDDLPPLGAVRHLDVKR
jgi:hypothetical protein